MTAPSHGEITARLAAIDGLIVLAEWVTLHRAASTCNDAVKAYRHPQARQALMAVRESFKRAAAEVDTTGTDGLDHAGRAARLRRLADLIEAQA